MTELEVYWVYGRYFDILVRPREPMDFDDPDLEWLNYPGIDIYVKDDNGDRIETYGTTTPSPEAWLAENDNVDEQQALLKIWSETYG